VQSLVRATRVSLPLGVSSAALLLGASGASTPNSGPTPSVTSTTSAPAGTTSTQAGPGTTVAPLTSPSAVAACKANAASVETAVQGFDTVHGYWPTSPNQLVGPGGELEGWPDNPRYYSISLGADGTVDVAPAPGTLGHALGPQNYDTYTVPGVGNICATV